MSEHPVSENDSLEANFADPTDIEQFKKSHVHAKGTQKQ